MFAVTVVYSKSKDVFFLVMDRIKAFPSGKHQRGCLECDVICHNPFLKQNIPRKGHMVTRLHWSCGFCRFRRMYYGKMPGRFEVQPWTVYVHVHRRYAWIKNLIMHRLLNMIEWLAN